MADKQTISGDDGFGDRKLISNVSRTQGESDTKDPMRFIKQQDARRNSVDQFRRGSKRAGLERDLSR